MPPRTRLEAVVGVTAVGFGLGQVYDWPAARRQAFLLRTGVALTLGPALLDVASFPFSPPPDWGYSLPVVYLLWVGVVVGMYPLCRWFAALKQRRSDARLSYL